MDLELTGKVAIIGGASQGLGRASAEVLAGEGCRITMCSRTSESLERAAAEIRDTTGAEVMTYAGDLESYDTIKDLIARTVEHYGQLDIMVNNSGGPPLARSANANEEQWETAVQRSLYFFARHVAGGRPPPQGTGRWADHQHPGQHGLSAHPQPGPVRRDTDGSGGLRQEPGRRGGPGWHPGEQRLPGSILTERMLSNVTNRANELGISVEEGLASRAEETAVGRIGEPKELGYLVGFLASGKSSYITGTTILVDGGLVRAVM